MKSFFKSTSFKCIAVLLSIMLICGVFLTICNALFHVSDEEKLQRAINKIYGKETQVTEVQADKDDKILDTSTILAAYLDEHGDYLVKAEGLGGYAGTVTCWVLVDVESGKVAGVKQVKIDSSQGETLLSNLTHLDKYAQAQYSDGFVYSTDNGFVTANVTLSSTAINNCVNGSITFVRLTCLGEENKDPYKDFKYTKYINKDTIEIFTAENGSVTYKFKTTALNGSSNFEMQITVNSEKTIEEYTVLTNGSTFSYTELYQKEQIEQMMTGLSAQDITGILNVSDENFTYSDAVLNEYGGTVLTGATSSNFLSLYAGLFAVVNYDLAVTFEGGNG